LKTRFFCTFNACIKNMGRAYTYRCNRCGFEAQFNEGHGFLIHPQSLDSYLQKSEILFHHKTHNLLKQLAKQNNQLFIDAGFKTYKCPHCKLLYDKVSITVTDNGKALHKSEFRCNRCRARLKLTNIHRLKSAVCPACKNPTFHIDQRKMILWD
jgi:DNA-directed RNA polymerase subunit RPC12/RpoP